MRVFYFLFLIAFCVTVGANAEKSLSLKKTEIKIIIDGKIDEGWSAADSAEIGFQMQPYFNQPPSDRTVVKVLADDESLYALFICYAHQNEIEVNTATWDNLGGDAVSIMLDTFNDKQTAYKLAVSSSGAQADARMLDDARNRDYSWDGIWFADVSVFSWGYIVELEVPFKSIQYDESAVSWGLDFDRWIANNSEDLYWCEYEKNEGMRISKFGTLNFDEGLSQSKGLNLEVFPVAFSKAEYLDSGKYKVNLNAGLDLMYNPSPQLKVLLTANPDFAQIEADPYNFNISRYESFFSERRPFFTEGSEIFTASGRQRNTGFYRPLELFYSRRIGKLLPDGNEVPLILGAKAFGRISDWEYGGFVAATGEKDYLLDGENRTEESAYFGSARVKKQILDNSSVGFLFVGKQTKNNTYGVIDIDGAFRESTWQFSYQLARSVQNDKGDFAASAGFVSFGENMMTFIRGRYVGKNFDISQVGYVPWKGTAELTAISGPVWLPEEGYISQILLYGGFNLYDEKADMFVDHSGVLGFNMQFRDNWGYEINLSMGKSRDSDIKYSSYEASLSSWFHVSPKWHANFYGGYTKTYNFSRDYLAHYAWTGIYFSWKPFYLMDIGTSYDMYIEGRPGGGIEDITYNARPFFSVTPFNNLNIRVYVDNVFVRSSDKLERVIAGLLFSYNFSPKSWIYFAVNERRDRSEEYDGSGTVLPLRMHVTNRAAVLKIKYLYYF